MLTESEKKVLSIIDRSTNDLVECLRKLISFKTVTPDDGKHFESDDARKLQDFVSKILSKMEFETESWEVDCLKLESFPGSGVQRKRNLANMPVLVGRRKGSGGGRSLILNGHYDVVPPGIIENWKHNPYAGEIDGNRLYGRGSNDMKGGIAAMLQSLRCIREAGIKLKGEVIVQTVPDEEASSMGTLSCCQRGYRADAAIIPEPTHLEILVAVRGSLYGKITVLGRAGHAEMPQPHWTEGGSVNAIEKALKVLAALQELREEWRTRPDKQHKYVQPDTIMPTVINGGEWPVTYPEKVEIRFSCMFVPGTRNPLEEIQKKISAVAQSDPWLKENPPKLEAADWWYGAEVDEKEPIVQTGLKVLEDLGIEPKLRGYGTLTDCIHLINYSKIPTISIGPDIKTAHMADEFVDLEQLTNTTKAMSLAIMRWCG